MRWQGGRRSENIEDRRGVAVRRGVQLGGGGIVLALVYTLLTGDPSALLRALLDTGGGGSVPTQRRSAPSPGEDERADFVSVVLADTEDTWAALFKQERHRYQAPKLVLFRDAVESACGFADAAVGPFYCPGDRKVYLDLTFFQELAQRFGAPGDFAQAYVVAHEIGHHVQNLLGYSDRINAMRARASQPQANALSVRLELQADCLAGVWAHHADKARHLLETGDVEQALRAATSIGDDTLQRRARGRVAPETFTHGTSEQRVRWFRQGLTGGTVEGCDTMRAQAL